MNAKIEYSGLLLLLFRSKNENKQKIIIVENMSKERRPLFAIQWK